MNAVLSILLFSLFSLFENNSVELTFVGDAMQHGPQIRAASCADGTYDYSDCFKWVEDDIKNADFAVANLECPLGGKPYSGYPAFSAPDEYAEQLQRVGFDLLTTANNHCLDRRDKGLKRTVSVLDRMGMPHVGTYANVTERDKLLPLIVNVKGVKIAFLSYTYGTNGIPVQGDAVVDLIDRDLIKKDIGRARLSGARLICVCVHWGEEYHLEPVKSQRDLADFLVDEGVDMIIGNHPHVVEPMEVRYSPRYGKKVLLVYSLGNFISNQNTIDSRGGALIKVKFTNKISSVELNSAVCKLFFVQKPRNKGENFVLIPEGRDDLLRPDSKADFNRFMTRVRNLVLSKNKGVDVEK